MPSAKFAAAQCAVRAGDISFNLALHLRFMQEAQHHKVALLVFPELSLTGYEPTLAQALAQDAECALLAPLRKLAQEASMTTVVGLPLRGPQHDKPLIGAFILHGDGSLGIYTKQYLHPGEEQYFSAGDGGHPVHMAGLPVALAVCADFSHAEHAASAAGQGAQLYAASVLIGASGYAHDSMLLQGYAKRHRMPVLMANHGGPTGGWNAAGRSAFWDAQGQCIAATAGPGNRLLMVSRQGQQWQGSDVAVPLT